MEFATIGTIEAVSTRKVVTTTLPAIDVTAVSALKRNSRPSIPAPPYSRTLVPHVQRSCQTKFTRIAASTAMIVAMT